ncbi:MAG: serine/threonine-protein kinase [Dehalococcoidia bacterium]|nr:serine/threonine-protein kinase [Dehalococcoidia bacterium]
MVSTTVIKNIGRFQLREVVGSGGLATLYRAYDTPHDKEVALKVFYAYFTNDSQALEVLRRDLDVLRSFRHPNLVEVSEYGEDAGYFWIVQEYVADKSLRYLVEGRVRRDLALDIVVQLADVLWEAHKVGLVHGNIKPSNVFLSEAGQVRLSDFGMARMVSVLPFAVRMGMSTPMPGFMSPEQASGGPVDERSDVYSLGLLLYWLLTNELPFYGNSPETVYAKQMKSPAPPPSKLSSWISSGLDGVLAKALAPFATIRYGSMKEFRDALAVELETAKALEIATGDTGLNYERGATPAGVIRNDELSSTQDAMYDTEGRRRTPLKWIRLTVPPMSRRKRIKILASVCTTLTVLMASWWATSYVKANISFLPPPASAASVDSSAGQWESLRGDVLNSGSRASLTLPKGEISWKFDVGQPFFASAVLSNSRVYAGTGDNRLVALDSSNGRIIWEWSTTGPVDAAPLVADGRVYLGLRDKRIVALDADSGKELWEFFTGNPILASPSVKDGVLYAGSGDGLLYALDAATGDLRWSFKTGSWILSTPALIDGLVVTGSEDAWLYVVRASTGAKVFSYFTGGQIHSTPAVDSNRIYVTNRTGRIWAIDARSKDRFFDKEGQALHAQFYLWNVADPPPPQKGTLWGTRFRGEVLTSPAVANETVVVGSSRGNVYAFNAADGSQVWQYEAGSPVMSAPSIGNGVVYFGDDKGRFNALELSTGKLLWSLQLQGKVRTSPALGNGTVYVTTEDGVLYGIK